MASIQAPDDVVRAARSGDPAAIERVLITEEPRLYRFVLRLCRDPEDAKDVLQQSLLAAAQALPRFEGRASLSGWLHTIARNSCIRHRRLRRSEPEVMQGLEGAAADVPDEAPLPEEAAATLEMSTLVDRALSKLAPDLREAVMLRDMQGLTASEAASVVGVTVSAFKSRLHRGRAELRETLAPVLGRIDPPGPGCPDILALYSGHLEGDISNEVCAAMQGHIRDCVRCRRACDSLEEALLLCEAAPANVPADVQEAVRRELHGLLQAQPSP